jgi:hypothetical protein
MSCCPKLDRKDLFAVLLFLIVSLVFFASFLTGDLIMAFKDLSRYFYPLRYLMVAQVKSGHLPLWNPYLFCGFPLLATLQVCFFYPLTLIYYILPFNLAFNYYIILHYFLAACFMYALLRHFKLESAPAFFGGLIFAFSGYLLSVSNMNTSLSSVIWLPLVVLVWDRIVNNLGNRRLNVAVSSLLLALMFLGGEPTILYTTGWFLFFYTLVFAKEKLKSLAALLFSCLLAGGLVAVQLVPFLELARLSDRVVRTGFDLVSFRSFPPRELLTFIFPYFFGNPTQFGGYTETLLGKTYQDWLISPYLGVLPLVFTFFAKRDKLGRFLWATALISLLLAFGRYTPLYQLLYYCLPGISLIRYPVKYLFLTTFGLSFLAALGLAQLIGFWAGETQAYRRALKFVLPIIAAWLALSLTGYFFLGQLIGFFSRQYSASIPAIFFTILENIIRFNLQSFFNAAAYFVVFAALLWAAARSRISRKVFSFSLILIAAADLLANGYSIVVAAPAQVYASVPTNYLYILKDRGLNRMFYTPETAKANQLLASGDTYSEALFNAKDNFSADWPVLYQLFDFSGYESIEPYQFSQFYKHELATDKLKHNLKYLPLLNVKYIIASRPLNYPELKFLRHKAKFGQNIFLYEEKKVLPRAYFLNSHNGPDLKVGKAEIDFYRPGFISLKTSAKAAARLFLSEAWYPGWRVLVDGKSAEIIKAEQFFQAIDLPAGEHEVKFVYDPWSFKLGAGISLLTAVVLLGLGWKVKRKK